MSASAHKDDVLGFRLPLHSDTVTVPSRGMREAMANAAVGDEQRLEDPTVNALQERLAAMLEREAALFLPSATMANQIAVRLHCRQGEEAICHELSHIANWEAGGMAALSGAQPRPLPGPGGMFSVERAEAALRGENLHNPPTALICVENTTNLGGGRVWPMDTLRAMRIMASNHDLPMHLDGSRIFNAAVAMTGEEHPSAESICEQARQIAHLFESVTVCFSKGLGAPVGAALVGNRPFIERARRLKHQFGGAMRQAGIIAAGALYALEHNLERLVDSHRLARRLARGLARVPGLEIAPAEVETNTVMPKVVASGASTADFREELMRLGIGCHAYGHHFRLVTHLDLTKEMIDEAIEIISAEAKRRWG